MKHTRSDVVKVISKFVGAKRGDSIHRYILDTYNNAMGTNWNVRTPWCAITYSVPAIILGYRDIIPVSASCGDLINKARLMGIWVENDAYIPKPGDGIIYAWDDGKDYAVTDNKDGHEHVGTVVYVSKDKGYFTVIEGNMGSNSACGTRDVEFNGRYIRGFICPKYDEEEKPKTDPSNHPIYYTVSKGDYLSKIAKRMGTTVDAIMALNPQIENKNLIYPGQRIRVK